jgi:hypothetical protein
LTVGVARVPGRLGADGALGGAPRPGASERIYAGLLRAYPRAFRARYGDEMVLLFGDQLRDARAAQGAGGLAGTWIRTLFDLLSSAAGEHLRRDRDVAQSLATFDPTRSMRLLGLFGVLGAVMLLFAFVSWDPFATLWINNVRLVLFGLAGAAVALAFHGRQALVAPRLALIATAAVVIAGVWYSTWAILSNLVTSPLMGTFGLVYLFANIALWVSPAVWSIGMLHTGAAWHGMSRGRAALTRLALVSLIGSVVAWLGDDRLGMVDSLWGEMWQAVAIAGVVMNGAGWLILGLVLVVPGRSSRAEA